MFRAWLENSISENIPQDEQEQLLRLLAPRSGTESTPAPHSARHVPAEDERPPFVKAGGRQKKSRVIPITAHPAYRTRVRNTTRVALRTEHVALRTAPEEPSSHPAPIPFAKYLLKLHTDTAGVEMLEYVIALTLVFCFTVAVVSLATHFPLIALAACGAVALAWRRARRQRLALTAPISADIRTAPAHTPHAERVWVIAAG